MLKYCGILVLSIILVLSSAGCTGMGNNNVKTNQYQPHAAKSPIIQDLTLNRAHVRTYATFNKIDSDKITKDVLGVSGISKSTVIVYDSEAIVGIDVKKGQKTWRVEQKALQAVKNSGFRYNVHVTADKKLYTRIESIRKQMVSHPNRDFSGDIRILIHDINLKVTSPTPTPTPTPKPKHWHKPTPTPTPTPTHRHTR
jgi:GTPase Era involved in 16S rRNA processing